MLLWASLWAGAGDAVDVGSALGPVELLVLVGVRGWRARLYSNEHTKHRELELVTDALRENSVVRRLARGSDPKEMAVEACPEEVTF